MDLHLDDFYVYDVDTVANSPWRVNTVDPYDQKSINHMFSQWRRLPADIPPMGRFLMSTKENISIHKGFIGFITLRSTWARLGLLSPSTVADPGFSGTLTMEVFNSSKHSILIRPGDSVWSMITVPLSPESEKMYKGRYQGQQGLQLPKALQPLPIKDKHLGISHEISSSSMSTKFNKDTGRYL